MTLLSESRTDAFPVEGGCPPDGDADPSPARLDADDLLARFARVRSASRSFCEGLAPEDFVVQTIEDVSPTKWHLAHTSWFFETFLLKHEDSPVDYAEIDPLYAYLFNSYYVSVGDRHCRMKRGTISRPTTAEVFGYRDHVDRHMTLLLKAMKGSADLANALAPLVEVGLNHEQQHQELMATDLKHVFASNPLYPKYVENAPPIEDPGPMRWLRFGEGVREIGHDGDGFAYDNESPRHRVFLEPFELASRPVTNGEWQQFIDDGGYERPEFWLSAAWATLQADRANWSAPLYWDKADGEGWRQFTMSGMRAIDPHEPVHHVSYYEADAFARWSGHRLPSEFEWETACVEAEHAPANLADTGHFHPRLTRSDGLTGMIGGVWEWTGSQYTAYPGYRPPAGALGEYNGKFMCNQFVLRGGSCATPPGHVRPTYRNFFAPDSRWQYTGLRLARSV